MKLYSIAITDNKLNILDIIARSNKPMNATAISKLNSEIKSQPLLQPTVQRTVTKLRKEGLVRVKKSKNIKNAIRNDLFLTDAGLCNYILGLNDYYEKKLQSKNSTSEKESTSEKDSTPKKESTSKKEEPLPVEDFDLEENYISEEDTTIKSIFDLLKKLEYVNPSVKDYLSSYEYLINIGKKDKFTTQEILRAIDNFEYALYGACHKTLSNVNLIPYTNKSGNLNKKKHLYVEYKKEIHNNFTFYLFNQLNYFFPVDSDDTLYAKVGKFILTEFKKSETKYIIIEELEIQLMEYNRYSNLLDDLKEE